MKSWSKESYFHAPTAIVPMGIWYQGEPPFKWLTPKIAVGVPIEGPFENPSAVMRPFRKRYLSASIMPALVLVHSRVELYGANAWFVARQMVC